MSKILIIFTGGTISMREDKSKGGTIPGLSASSLLAMIKNLDQYADIEVLEFGEFPGPQMVPRRILALSQRIRHELLREDIQGIIVTHGTDTLEETAYFLDLNIQSEKPVVVIGAMRNSSELGFDGPANIAAGIITVKSPESRGKGVLVVLNNQVNSAREVTKTHTLTLDTFKSMEFGPLGIVDHNEVIYMRQTIEHGYLPVDDIEEEVYLLKSYTGMKGVEIDFLVQHGAKGIVIEAMGRGNLPPEMLPALERAIQQNVVIVMVSRCPTGRVLGTYAYDGGGRQARDLGVLFGTSMNGQKMRIKLMLAMAYTKDPDKLRLIIENEQFHV